MPQDGLHLDEVHDTLEVLLSTDRNLDSNRIGTQDILHLLYGLKEVGTRTVHLVDITDTWHVVLVSLTPHSL